MLRYWYQRLCCLFGKHDTTIIVRQDANHLILVCPCCGYREPALRETTR